MDDAWTLAHLPGALLGDLLFGNRKSMVIGATVMGTGALALCVPSIIALYTGMAMLCIGLGLFDSNFLAQFGKHYRDRPHLLDSRFTFLYAVVNIAAFAGAFALTTLTWSGNFTIGFALCGILLLGSGIIILFVNTQEIAQQQSYKLGKALPIVCSVILIGAVFWTIYEFTAESMYVLQEELVRTYPEAPWMISYGAVFFLVPLCLVAGAVWMHKLYSSWIKLATGLLFGALAYVLLLTMLGNSHVSRLDYGLAMLLLALSELHLQPIIYSLIARYANPKYLAIVMALYTMPTKIFGYFYPIYLLHRQGQETQELIVSAIVLAVIAVSIGVFVAVKRKSQNLMASS